MGETINFYQSLVCLSSKSNHLKRPNFLAVDAQQYTYELIWISSISILQWMHRVSKNEQDTVPNNVDGNNIAKLLPFLIRPNIKASCLLMFLIGSPISSYTMIYLASTCLDTLIDLLLRVKGCDVLSLNMLHPLYFDLVIYKRLNLV